MVFYYKERDHEQPSSDKAFIGNFDPELTIAPEEYEPYVGKNQIEELKRLADPLAEKGWVISTLP